VHDAPEVYAGDTPTLRIDTAGRAAKAAREAAAVARIEEELGDSLAWMPALLARYERQHEPEVRFVRGVDKVLPKAVSTIDEGRGLRSVGIGRAELRTNYAALSADMKRYVGEFRELIDLGAELNQRVLSRPDMLP
jgi:5'-deoxynucleotidase YfbR-like HD superfamily hydrolase